MVFAANPRCIVARTMMRRRTFLHGAAAVGAAAMLPRRAMAAADLKPIYDQIEKRHGDALARLQEWIRQPTIAAENRGITEGRDLTMRLLRDAGFAKVESVPTDGHPGIFATLDAGAPRTIGLYFMYDVKQVDPKEWSSPPWDAAVVDLPKLGKVVMGRGAVNQKGPAGGVPRRAARDPRRRQEAAGQPGARRRRRGGDRLAALPADRAPTRRCGPRSSAARASSCRTPARAATAP